MSETVEIDQNFGLPERSKYPFGKLQVGGAFKTDDLTKYQTLRSAASRAGKAMKKRFSVKKITEKKVDKIVVIRVK